MPDDLDPLDLPRPRADAPAGSAPLLAGRRVLVTGAGGFIGRHLLRHLLDAGAEVHAAVRGPSVAGRLGLPSRGHVTRHGGDLADRADTTRVLRASDPQIVFHLASRVVGHRDPGLVGPMLEDNVHAALNVMTAAHELGNRHVVLAGSVEEPHAAGEAPCSPYAAAKLAATNYALLFHEQWDLPVTVLRPAMVYGPEQLDERKLVPHVVTSMLAGREPRLGSGDRLIDWVFVDDVCRAFLAAATRPAAPGLVADVGSGRATTIADTVRSLADLTGYDGPLGLGSRGDRRHDTARIADPTAATDALGWSPETPLETGLARTVQWYRSRRDADRLTVRGRGETGSRLAVVRPPRTG